MQDVNNTNTFRLTLCMQLLDVFALIVAGHIAAYLRFHAPLVEIAPIHAVLLYFCCAVAFLLFPQLALYLSWRGRSLPSQFFALASSWTVVVLIGVVFSFLIHHIGALSRLWVLYWYLIGLTLLIVCRCAAHASLRYLRTKGRNSKQVLIVGYGPVGQEMYRRATQQNWYGYDVKAIHAGADDDVATLAGQPVVLLQKMDQIPPFVDAHGIDEIWITLPMNAAAQLLSLQYLLRNALVDIRWIPNSVGMQILSHRMIDFLGFTAIDLNRSGASGVGGVLKDALDKLFSAVVLVCLVPAFIAIAIAIKSSSPGPVFFRQPRLGLNGKKFNVYKFRTMKVHQEIGVVTQATQHDPRITRIGQFLRRSSLDELPQFLNVLLGDMSVVGPRPHALPHNELYKDLIETYMLRHRVKPGITGWAQVNGYRGETDTIDKMAKRVQFDLHYIQHWSLWMDIRIIAWTAFKGWKDKNAY